MEGQISVNQSRSEDFHEAELLLCLFVPLYLLPWLSSIQVASVKWNDYSEILVAIADGKLVVWYYPSVVFIDRDLLPKTKIIRDDAYGHREVRGVEDFPPLFIITYYEQEVAGIGHRCKTPHKHAHNLTYITPGTIRVTIK